ncbi:hypothetical protein D5085_17740 [Ectothiorhodospiraceae bacterium BW-2]|nr:hypothetical protein D5085_17740 [Ectothiorhodospiraceae bacterium BW-2]
MTKQLQRAIDDNLHFLVIEVASQLATLTHYLQQPSETVGEALLGRSGYGYNLKVRIQNHCLELLKESEAANVHYWRGIETVASELAQITALGRHIVHQVDHLQRPSQLKQSKLAQWLEIVQTAIADIEPALAQKNSRLALKIGRSEARLDRHYARYWRQTLKQLQRGRAPEERLLLLRIAQLIEQMGDSLLLMSEAIISGNVGQPLDMESFYSLQASIESLTEEGDAESVSMRSIAETRSGSGISALTLSRGEQQTTAIYKAGQKRKLKEEREGVESWHEIYPGLAPRILSYKKRGESAALLIEHLAGETFERIVLHQSQAQIMTALKYLNRTLSQVWLETRRNQPIQANHMAQLRQRLPDVYAIHPHFQNGSVTIGGSRLRSFEQLLQRAEEVEQQLIAPFSVYIHGDFNVDNVIFDPNEKRINFIDLHRSCYMDYVQDIAVFMVSNYRLRILDQQVRQRIMLLCRRFYQNRRQFALKQRDKSFDARLALGLVRSFATSTRFILDQTLAEEMFYRSHYLLEQLLAATPQRLKKFRLPIEALFRG